MPSKGKKNRRSRPTSGQHASRSRTLETQSAGGGKPKPADDEEEEWPPLSKTETTNVVVSDEQPTPNVASGGVNIIHNIISTNTQIGDANVIVAGTSSDANDSADRDSAGTRSKNFDQITTKHLNINYHITSVSGTHGDPSSDTTREKEIRKFAEYVGDFDDGDFILITGKLKGIKNLGSLSHIQWKAVLDYDTESRFNGLLSYTEETLEKKTSLHINTWQDKFHFTDINCCWIFMRGTSDRPDTVIDNNFIEWRKTTRTCIKEIVKGLDDFKSGCSEFTIIALWSEDEEIRRFLNYTLGKLEEVNPRIMIVTNGNDTSGLSSDFLEEFDSVELNTQDICNVIGRKFSQNVDHVSNSYCLPTSDQTDDPGIDDREAQMLKEELEIIYLDNKTGVEHSCKELIAEEENFFRGGTLPWSWWYNASEGQADVERDIMSSILKYVKQEHIDQCKTGRVTLYHFPGSGGTTLAQRVLWKLKTEIPCAQVLHRSDPSLAGLVEKVQLLSDKTHLPILLLLDGEEEQKVEQIQSIFSCCVIIFYVKRCLTTPYLRYGEFWLQQYVSKREGKILGIKYMNQCDKLKKTEKQRRCVESLIEEVEQGKDHSIFEIGLAVHSFEYKGIYSYVRGFLCLRDSADKKLLARHKILIWLALAYYYGQTSVPCQFLSNIIEAKSEKKTLQFQDLPDDTKDLIVCDQHERRRNMIRISHFYVAKEILNQVLLWIQNEPESSAISLNPHISVKAKMKLAPFVKEFILNAGRVSKNVATDTVLKVLIRTIISRSNTAVGENETEASRSKKPRFSPLLEDVSFQKPFKERFDLLTTLTEAFPQEPQFYAHLGRLYAICKPEQDNEAERCFQKALDICGTITKHLSHERIPLNRKLDLMHIYHMYGNMLTTRASQYTGRQMNDTPKKKTNQKDIKKITDDLLDHTHRACEYFIKCREVTPPGWENIIGYTGEINIRLMFCDFINRHICKGKEMDIRRFIDNDKTDLGKFVCDCFIELDELFSECFSSIESDKIDESILKCQTWFHFLFQCRPGYVIDRHSEGLHSSRKKIAMIKMKYGDSKSHGTLEMVQSGEDIESIVQEYEKILKSLEVRQRQSFPYISHKDVDTDYKEWLFAIRHSLFSRCYEVECVLEEVQKWFDSVKSQDARFYLFILHTLLGIGDEKAKGDPGHLKEAQTMKDDLVKLSRFSYRTKPKYPREWLGPEQSKLGIKRITPGKRYFGGDKENYDLSTTDLHLEIMKGTIRPPNDKPACGYIDLDLGPANKTAVKVFYIPAKYNLKGKMNQGTRVQFVIGFTMMHGYEAFQVAKLGRVTCKGCKKLVECRKCEKKVSCSECMTEMGLN